MPVNMLKTIIPLVVLSVVAAKRYDGYHLIQFEDVWEAYEESLPFIKSRRVVHFSDPKHTMDLVIAPELVRKFTATRHPDSYNIVQTNVQDWIDREARVNEEQKQKEKAMYGDEVPLAAPERYLRYQEIRNWMSNIANRHRDITSIEEMGLTYENRNMTVLKISTGSGRRKIWLDCGIHAREWISPSTCLWVTAKLLNDYRSNSDSRRMLDNFDWFVVPVANPDGYENTFEDGDEGDRLWRKNMRPTEEDPECIGTDTNRNWDISWNGEGVSPFPCLDTWPGDRAFSEPSTQVMSRYINANKDNMIMLISMHSFTQLWLVPFGYEWDAYPPDYNDLMFVGNETAVAIRQVNGREFIVGTPPDILYAASGSSMDWAKAVAGIKYSYSPELRPESPLDGGFIIDAVPNIRESGEEIFAGIARATQLI